MMIFLQMDNTDIVLQANSCVKYSEGQKPRDKIWQTDIDQNDKSW